MALIIEDYWQYYLCGSPLSFFHPDRLARLNSTDRQMIDTLARSLNLLTVTGRRLLNGK
jgi:hypothetical protein